MFGSRGLLLPLTSGSLKYAVPFNTPLLSSCSRQGCVLGPGGPEWGRMARPKTQSCPPRSLRGEICTLHAFLVIRQRMRGGVSGHNHYFPAELLKQASPLAPPRHDSRLGRQGEGGEGMLMDRNQPWPTCVGEEGRPLNKEGHQPL